MTTGPGISQQKTADDTGGGPKDVDNGYTAVPHNIRTDFIERLATQLEGPNTLGDLASRNQALTAIFGIFLLFFMAYLDAVFKDRADREAIAERATRQSH